MQNFLTFLDQNSSGLFVLAVAILFMILVVQWLAWIFHIGRYKKQDGAVASNSNREKTTQFVFGEFLAKVISDFRNLLAVLIVLFFGLVLAFAVFRSANQTEMASALQAVMSTLGGLVGSIVGYYFGESAVKSAGTTTPMPGQAPMQTPPAVAGSLEENVKRSEGPGKTPTEEPKG